MHVSSGHTMVSEYLCLIPGCNVFYMRSKYYIQVCMYI